MRIGEAIERHRCAQATKIEPIVLIVIDDTRSAGMSCRLSCRSISAHCINVLSFIRHRVLLAVWVSSILICDVEPVEYATRDLTTTGKFGFVALPWIDSTPCSRSQSSRTRTVRNGGICTLAGVLRTYLARKLGSP